MSREKQLIESLTSCFSDWGNDFDIDVEAQDRWKGYEFFDVIITHFRLGGMYEFGARVDKDGNCEMDFYEDDWHSIGQGEVFAFMWFEEAKDRGGA